MFTTRVPMEKLKIEKLFKNEEIKYLGEAPKAPPKEIIKIDILSGGSYRIRTYDQLIKSQLLYQLS